MMVGWSEMILNEIAPYWNGKIDGFKLNSKNYISADNMVADRGGIEDSSYVPTSGKSIQFSKGDILVSNIRPYFKKIWYAKFNGGCSNDVIVFRTKPEIADSKFVYYYLSKDDFFDFMMAGANGTKMPRGNRKSIPNYIFNLPPLPTQRKIAAILSAYDDLIENNLKRINLLEEKAQLTYEEWFVRMKFPGHESTPINEETGLPEGWEKKYLGDVCETMQYGYTASASDQKVGPKFLRITDIVGDNISWENVPYCSIEEKDKFKYLLKEGDIVIARTGATVGYAKRMNKNSPEAVFASYLIRLKLKSEIDDVFLGVFVESQKFVEIVQNMAGGAAQPNANAPVLKQIKLIIPPFPLQKTFRELVINLKDSQQLLLYQNNLLKEARDILLPRLMTGMIDVDALDLSAFEGNDQEEMMMVAEESVKYSKKQSL